MIMLAKYMGQQKLKEEIAKCDVVCSNCHRIRTSKRAGWKLNYWWT